MYLEFFGLEKTPFSREVDPDCLFWAPAHREAFENLQRGIEERKGLMALIGGRGIGKTTLVRSVLESIDSPLLKVIHLQSVRISFSELLMTVAHELGVALEPNSPSHTVNHHNGTNGWEPVSPRDDIATLLRTLQTALLRAEHKYGSNVVLIIDDAQDLPGRTFVDLYLLATLAVPKGKLLQTILIGHTAMALKLELPQLRKLRQSLAVRASLASLTAEESLAYLQARLKKIPSDHVPLFTTEALHLLATRGKGNPLFLNILCDTALIVGCENQQRPVSSLLAREVITDVAEVEAGELPDSRALVVVGRSPKREPFSFPGLSFLRAVVVGALVGFLALFSYQRIEHRWKNSLFYLSRTIWGNLVTEAASEESNKSTPPPLSTSEIISQKGALEEKTARASRPPREGIRDVVVLRERKSAVTTPVLERSSSAGKAPQREQKRPLREEQQPKIVKGKTQRDDQSRKVLLLQTPQKKELRVKMTPKNERPPQVKPDKDSANWDRLFDQ